MKKALRITGRLLAIAITIYILYFKYEIDIIDRVFVLANILLYVVPDIQSELKIKK
jgi:phage-related protein